MIVQGTNIRPLLFRNRIKCIIFVVGILIHAVPASADEREFGHERAACTAWDIHLRYLLETRVEQATLSSEEGIVILDEVKHASRLCMDGRFRSAFDRFALLFDLLSGEKEERDNRG